MHDGGSRRRGATTDRQQQGATRRRRSLALAQHERVRIVVLSIRAASDTARSKALGGAMRVVFADSDVERRLVLLPGKTDSWPVPETVHRAAEEAGATILFEAHAPPNVRWAAHDAELGDLGVYIEQVFGTSKQANHEPERVERVLRECREGGERTLRLAGVEVGLLCCGENNLLANEQSNGNAVYVRHHEDEDLFEHVRVVFNGAHTNMGNWGKLDRRFEYLSRDRRFALYVTNNGADRKSWGSAIRVYFDGQLVADGEGVHVEPTEFAVKLIEDKSKVDGWRALVLDADARLLAAEPRGRR